jgi:hypothetical protein
MFPQQRDSKNYFKNIFKFLILSYFLSLFSIYSQDMPAIFEGEIKESKKVKFQNKNNIKASEDKLQKDLKTGESLSEISQSGSLDKADEISIKRYLPDGKKMGGDVITIGEKFKAGHIHTIKRIISSYIQKSFDYDTKSADILTYYVLYYNVMHRKNLKYFKNKYSKSMLNDLTLKNVGISKKFNEWAGNTQLIIPLSKNILKNKKTDLTISELEQAVNKDLDKKKKGTEVKAELGNLVKDKTSEERKLLEEKKKEVSEKEKVLTKAETEQVKKMEDLKKDPEPNQEEIKKAEETTDELKKEKEKISEEKKEIQEKDKELTKIEKKIEKAKEEAVSKQAEKPNDKSPEATDKESKEKAQTKTEENKGSTTEIKNSTDKSAEKKETPKPQELKKDENPLAQKADELKKKEEELNKEVPKKAEEPKKEDTLAKVETKKEKDSNPKENPSPSKDTNKEENPTKDIAKDLSREATKEEVQPVKPQDPKVLEKEISEKSKQIQEITKELTELKKSVEDKQQKSDNLIGDKVLFLQVVKYENDGHFTNDLWVLDPDEEEGLYKSPFENICGRDFKILSTGVLVVGFEGQESDNTFHHLVLLNKEDLTVKKISKENIFWRSQLFLMDKKIYGFEIAEDKKIYLSRFSEDLVFEARSSEPMNIYSDITFNKTKIFVTSKLQGSTSTAIMILNKEDLKVLKSFKPTPKRILKK